jgi:hypothetical protein
MPDRYKMGLLLDMTKLTARVLDDGLYEIRKLVWDEEPTHEGLKPAREWLSVMTALAQALGLVQEGVSRDVE